MKITRTSCELIRFVVVVSTSTRWILFFQSTVCTELRFGNLVEWISRAWCKEPRNVESKKLGMLCLKKKCF